MLRRLAPWLALALALGCLAVGQLHLAWSPPPVPGAPLPLVGGGEQPDWAGTVWTWWWFGEAVREGLNPFVASRTFLPVGQAPLAWLNLLDAAVFSPFIHGLGPRVGYNVACAALLASVGLGAAALARAVGGGWPAAALVAVAVQTTPFVTVELLQGRAGQAWIALPLLTLAAAARAARAPGRGAAAATAVLLAATGLQYWFYAWFIGGAVLLLAAWAPSRAARRALLGALAGAAVLVAPAVAVVVAAWTDQPGVLDVADPVLAAEPLARGQQSLAFAIRTAHWPLWPVLDAPGDLTDKRMHPVFLGLAAAGLALAAPRRQGVPRWAWLAIAGVGWALSLGPFLRGWSGVTPIPLPWLLLHDVVPLFSRLWWPERAEVLVLGGAAALAASGAAAARARWGLRVTGPALALAAVALLTWRFRPVPAGPAPAVDRALYDSLDGALVTLPLLAPHDHGRKHLWAQTHHGHPILAGLGDHLPGHRPPGYEAYIDTNPLLRGLRDLSQGPLAATEVPPEAIEALRADGFRWVVFEAHAVRPGLARPWAAAWTRALAPVLGPPDHRSEGGLAWALHPIDAPAALPALPAVERAGQDQQLAPLQRGPPR